MGVVFLISSLLFRSFIGGALICVPLVATVLANFGALGLLGIPLQIFTALVSAMAVGIGADYAIYLSYRIREELERGGSEPDAVRGAFASAGKAILFVSSAVAGGYAILVLSFGFLLHLWMGILIALAMLVSSISALTLFAALILTLRPKFIFRKNTEEPIKLRKAPAHVSLLIPNWLQVSASTKLAEIDEGEGEEFEAKVMALGGLKAQQQAREVIFPGERPFHGEAAVI
jgi:uncharacterized protein